MGFMTFCSLIPKHMGRGGAAPAEAAGLRIGAPSPWDAPMRIAFWGVRIGWPAAAVPEDPRTRALPP